MGLLDWLFGAADKPAVITGAAAAPIGSVHVARGRGFTFDVVGESHYQDALDNICGGKCDDGHSQAVIAQLCFVEDNPHDPDAIAVFIRARMVGFVPRNVASPLRAEILRLNPDKRPVTCDAKIVGGWDRGDGDAGHYGVKLNISDPLRLKA